MTGLGDTFGSIDIYLFDQLLKGRLTPGMRVLDAGCGSGRNLVYLLQQGFGVWGVDSDPDPIGRTRALAARLAPGTDPERFVVAPVEQVPHGDGAFDFVISSAVLHFAQDETAFDAMVDDMWRVLADGGVMFARLASTIGMEDRVEPVSGRRHRLPDGSVRFLVDEAMLLERTHRLGAELLDPIKTTVVQDMRSMTTWVVKKSGDRT